MLDAVLVIPFVLFAFLVRATRYSWRLLFLLLIRVGPFLATALNIAGGVAFTDIGGLPPSFRDWVSLHSNHVLAHPPDGDHLSKERLRRYIGAARMDRLRALVMGSRSEDRAWRILIATGIGTAAGALFALLIFLAYQNSAFVDFVSAGDITSRKGYLPSQYQRASSPGAVDGALVAIAGVKSIRPKPLDRAVESATT